MPAKSQAQQKLMGMVHAVQKGEMKAPSAKVAKMAKTMKKKHAKDFASTKRKGLPVKVKEELSAPEIVARMLENESGCEECGFEVCPACGGDGAPMGKLGNRVHYRCRDCGIDFSRAQNDKPEVEVNDEEFKKQQGWLSHMNKKPTAEALLNEIYDVPPPPFARPSMGAHPHPSEESLWEVIDSEFNRQNYPDLIGKKFPRSKIPSYAQVKKIS